jgi:hypothetical protein
MPPLRAGQVNGKAIEQKAINLAHFSPHAVNGLRNVMDTVKEEKHTSGAKHAVTSQSANGERVSEGPVPKLSHQPQRHPPRSCCLQSL